MIVRAARGTILELDAEETRKLLTLLSYDASIPTEIRRQAGLAITQQQFARDAMYRDADDMDTFMPALYNAIVDAQ